MRNFIMIFDQIHDKHSENSYGTLRKIQNCVFYIFKKKKYCSISQSL